MTTRYITTERIILETLHSESVKYSLKLVFSIFFTNSDNIMVAYLIEENWKNLCE